MVPDLLIAHTEVGKCVGGHVNKIVRDVQWDRSVRTRVGRHSLGCLVFFSEGSVVAESKSRSQSRVLIPDPTVWVEFLERGLYLNSRS